MVNQKSANKNLNYNQKLIFKLIIVTIPFVILIVFEGVLRLFGYGDNLNLFIQNPTQGYENYMIVNPKVGKKYFQKFEYTAPANDTFLKKKKKGTYRIFVMGSSTVFGFPYDRNLMFSRILDHRLKEAYGNDRVEVVNTAITAINSYTLLDYADQIIEYEPDAVLVYAGHNEFYGAFGIGSNETMSRNRKLTQLHIAFMDLKIYQLLRNGISAMAQKVASSKSKVHGTLMKRIVANNDILLGSDDYKLAMERYEQNMTDLVQIFTKKEVPVFISEVVSNVKDIKPFNSIRTDNLLGANQYYEAAVESEFIGELDKAREQYKLAKDYDCIRFRASQDVNVIIKSIADANELSFVAMEEAFKNSSPKGLVGDNLMTEHVHPNIEGNFLMADVFYRSLYNSEVIAPKSSVSVSTYNYFKNNYGYTMLDSINALHNVKQLKSYWPFVKDNNGVKDYAKTYKPISYVDSAVFSSLVSKDISFSDVRVDLAKYYMQNKNYVRAFEEYNALVYTNPFVSINYRDAATCLTYLGDLPLAEKYFLKSLIWEETFYAYYKLGELYLIKADYNKAVEYFQKSYDFAPKNNRINVLIKSFMALVYANRNDDAQKIAAELKKVSPQKKLQIPPKQYVYDKYIPYQTKNEIDSAKILIENGKINEALSLLQKSLLIYDSHIANRLIGELYIKQNNYNKAGGYFGKVYHEFKFDPEFLYQYILLEAQLNNFTQAGKMRSMLKELDPAYAKLKELNSLNLN